MCRSDLHHLRQHHHLFEMSRLVGFQFQFPVTREPSTRPGRSAPRRWRAGAGGEPLMQLPQAGLKAKLLPLERRLVLEFPTQDHPGHGLRDGLGEEDVQFAAEFVDLPRSACTTLHVYMRSDQTGKKTRPRNSPSRSSPLL